MSIRPQGSAAFGVEGDGGSAAFGGVAPIYAPSAALSLAVYLFSPLVEDHEVLDWELRATERDAAIPAVPRGSRRSRRPRHARDPRYLCRQRRDLRSSHLAAGSGRGGGQRMEDLARRQRRRHPVRARCRLAGGASGGRAFQQRHHVRSAPGGGERRNLHFGGVFRRRHRCNHHRQQRRPDPRRRRSLPRRRRRHPRGP